MKLYRVQVEFHGGEDLMVLAPDDESAHDIAIESADLYNVDIRVSDTSEVKALTEVPQEWRDDTPISEEGCGETCAELIDLQKQQRCTEAEQPDPRQLPLRIKESK